MLLTDCLGGRVDDEHGSRLGRVSDLAVLEDSRSPRVTAVIVDRHRVGWQALTSFGADGATVRRAEDEPPVAGELRLGRDVLDGQIYDATGKRLTRVGDVELELSDGALVVTAVEVGLQPVLRRLGLRRLASRFPRERIAWNELRHAAVPGHALQLEHARREHLPPGRRYGRILRLRRRAPS